jgi:hypothetical protein
LRSQAAYWTPLALGLFAGWSGAPTSMALARTEAGLLWRGRALVLELGLGLGLGGLGVVYARTRCDADCVIGGVGLTASPVLRLVRGLGAKRSLGGFVRVVLPGSEGNFLGHNTGWAVLYLAGLDLGFGR